MQVSHGRLQAVRVSWQPSRCTQCGNIMPHLRSSRYVTPTNIKIVLVLDDSDAKDEAM